MENSLHVQKIHENRYWNWQRRFLLYALIHTFTNLVTASLSAV